MTIDNDKKVLFGLGLENGVNQADEMLAHAHVADQAGLDVFCVNDHPYFAQRLDAYAALGFVLGATSRIAGTVICTNLLSRPAPVLARTLTGLSTISGGRVILAIGAGGMEQEIISLGVPHLSPGERVGALEEAIEIVRGLSGGGEPITFDGKYYHVTELEPAEAPTPPIWFGVGGPKGLVATGRHADGWIPPHAADWRSKRVAESRPRLDEAAQAAGRDPSEVETIYLVSGSITRDPQSKTRDEEQDRWIGGGVAQWVEELTYAALERDAAAFVYLVPPDGDGLDDTTLDRWANEVVPAVREAIAKG
jgi:alkanesulfonate monooxygenase SsuD/methylene tetrahydromethanopterin reductase-like flavin-dependent oxidoreductase (luciferase family)